MRRIVTNVLVLGLAACGGAKATTVTLAARTTTPPAYVANDRRDDGRWRPDEHFRVHVEQDGVELPIRDREVRLARRPFTLAFELRGTRIIKVNASWKPDVQRLASARGDLDGVFGPARGFAEERTNPSHHMFTGEEGYNHWGWDAQVQRCHEHRERGDVMVCKRLVELLGPTGEEDVARETGAALHLVFLATEPNGDDDEHELQRAWLTLRF